MNNKRCPFSWNFYELGFLHQEEELKMGIKMGVSPIHNLLISVVLYFAISVTRLGDFWKFLETFFSLKLLKYMLTFWATLNSIPFKSKLLWLLFRLLMVKFLAPFYFNVQSHCSRSLLYFLFFCRFRFVFSRYRLSYKLCRYETKKFPPKSFRQKFLFYFIYIFTIVGVTLASSETKLQKLF